MYGKDLEMELMEDLKRFKTIALDREKRIDDGMTDYDDCFVSIQSESIGKQKTEMKLNILQNDGFSWFEEFATLDGALCKSALCETRYGFRWRIETPDGQVIWTSAETKKGLARIGLKKMLCKRPAWVKYEGFGTGLAGALNGTCVVFPSNTNFATGLPADREPIEIREVE